MLEAITKETHHGNHDTNIIVTSCILVRVGISQNSIIAGLLREVLTDK